MKTSSSIVIKPVRLSISIQFVGKVNDYRAFVRSSRTGNYQDRKIEIMKKELSSTVRKTLECDAFKSWLVVHAYKIQNGRLYEIELKMKM